MKRGPKTEMQHKFEEIDRTLDYSGKRKLIEQLSKQELADYNAILQQKYSTYVPSQLPGKSSSTLKENSNITANTLITEEDKKRKKISIS